jgi:ubiquinone/menaquinone biosynthesis C-methylase UbiE
VVCGGTSVAEERQAHDLWAIGGAYESYVGRWSRLVARELLRWLGVPSNSRWLDVGCGTGTLVETIVEHAAPRVVLGIDRSKGFVAHARARATDARIAFQVGDAQALAVADDTFDAVVSGLVLNFVSEPAKMVTEMVRAGRPGARSPYTCGTTPPGWS